MQRTWGARAGCRHARPPAPGILRSVHPHPHAKASPNGCAHARAPLTPNGCRCPERERARCYRRKGERGEGKKGELDWEPWEDGWTVPQSVRERMWSEKESNVQVALVFHHRVFSRTGGENNCRFRTRTSSDMLSPKVLIELCPNSFSHLRRFRCWVV
jgi:hypothetical protein